MSSAAAACSTVATSSVSDNSTKSKPPHTTLQARRHVPMMMDQIKKVWVPVPDHYSLITPSIFVYTIEAVAPDSPAISSLVLTFPNKDKCSVNQTDKIKQSTLEAFRIFIDYCNCGNFKNLYEAIAYFYEFPHAIEAATNHSKFPLTVLYNTGN